MNTIRQRLTLRLLLGWTGLLVAGGIIAYGCARSALTRQFDEVLYAKAIGLSSLTEQAPGRVFVEYADPFMRKLGAHDDSTFFQVWSGKETIIERSKSLHQANLPLRYGTLRKPAFWNLILPNQQAGRAAGMKFHPQISDDPEGKTGALEAYLVVATSRRGLDRTLASLRWILIGVDGLILLLTASIVPLLLHLELAPLNRLAEHAQNVTVETLSNRFRTEGLPGELLPISERLNDLLQRLQTAFNRERQFSDDLAHEFRTPIAELRSLAELAVKWPEVRRVNMDGQVRRIALQMESIINRLLAIARSEQAQAPAQLEDVDLAELITTIWQPLQAKAHARQLQLETIGPNSLKIESDPVLLQSIVTNLVENAVEYAPLKSTVRIESAIQEAKFSVRVINPVEHLAPEDVDHLFDRFWRKDHARTDSVHVGLGLSMARAFATSLGYALSATVNGDHRLILTLTGTLKIEKSKWPIVVL